MSPLKFIADSIRQSYAYLLILFTLVVFLVKIEVFPSWRLNLYLFVIILGLFSFALSKKRSTVRLPAYLVALSFFLVLVTRLLPYLDSSVPLGYDAGLYKFLFENPASEPWLRSMYPLAFSLIMGFLSWLTGSSFWLIYGLILFSALTTIVLFLVLKSLYSKEIGIIASLIYATSIAQFQTFWFMYYKNILGILLLLLGYLIIDKKKIISWQLILVGALLGGIHRPAFFIFGLTYIILLLYECKNKNFLYTKNAIINGIFMLIGAIIANIDRVDKYLFSGLLAVSNSIVTFSGSSGTFFDLNTYFSYSIPFLPFAITGFIHNYKKNIPISIGALITSTIVLCSLYFHNRFIIYFDIFIIIFASLGFIVLIKNYKVMGKFLLIFFLFSFFVLHFLHAQQVNALISQAEFEEIKNINNFIKENATILVTNSYYSPWIKGWVQAPIIAPGLFNEDKMSYDEWLDFWSGNNRERFLNRYEKPLYIHVGKLQPQYTFADCFTLVHKEQGTLYEYTC